MTSQLLPRFVLPVVASLVLASLSACGSSDANSDDDKSDAPAKEEGPKLSDDDCLNFAIAWAAPMVLQGKTEAEATEAAESLAATCKEKASDPEWVAFATCVNESGAIEMMDCKRPAGF